MSGQRVVRACVVRRCCQRTHAAHCLAHAASAHAQAAVADVVYAVTAGGMGYVWGGVTRGAQAPLGVQSVDVRRNRFGQVAEQLGEPLRYADTPQRLRKLDGAWQCSKCSHCALPA